MAKIIFLIILFSSIIYFYKLSTIPSGVYVDEATTAYNAWSITTTGADEFGMRYPFLFRLFGSYTPPVFIYPAAIIINNFGMAISTLRSISVISTLLAVYLFYKLLLAMKILNLRNTLVAVALFAIIPWVVFNARIGYETTFAFLIFFVGIYYCYLALRYPSKLAYGLSILTLSTYISYPARYLYLVFVPMYFLIFRKYIFSKKNASSLRKAFSIVLILNLPNLLSSLAPAFWVKNNALFEDGITTGLRDFTGQLLNYYSPKAIFFESPDIDLQHTIPGISLLYSWMVLPFFVGLYFLFKRRKEINYKYVLFLFSILVIPAALSGHFISIQRAYQFVIPLMIIVGIGIEEVTKKLPKLIFYFLLAFLIPFSLIRLYRSYFVLFPVERATAWNYGYDQLASEIKSNPDDNFLIDNSRNPRNYIELLYHMNYLPNQYQKEVDSSYKNNYYSAPVQDYVYSFGNVQVRSLVWESDPCNKQIIVGDTLTISENQAREHGLTKSFEITDKLNNVIFVGFETNPEIKCPSYKKLQ